MPAPDLVDLMGLYARRGIADWKKAPAELRNRALVCLGPTIADSEAEALIAIRTFYSAATPKPHKFIPMPKHPKGGVERCFFLPIREAQPNGQVRTAFELFLLVARKDCLAFRFEPADPPNSAHGYGHVQLSRNMVKKTVEVRGVPSWLPDSYPAFAIATSDPLRMFLMMATAVHGYSGGIVTVLQDVFQKASAYLGELKVMLN
jgi:hypothetical protein